MRGRFVERGGGSKVGINVERAAEGVVVILARSGGFAALDVLVIDEVVPSGGVNLGGMGGGGREDGDAAELKKSGKDKGGVIVVVAGAGDRAPRLGCGIDGSGCRCLSPFVEVLEPT